MDKYAEMAKKILDKIINSNETVKLSKKEALMVYNALLGMSRVLQIAESDTGGSELIT